MGVDLNFADISKCFLLNHYQHDSGWWFQIFFIFTPTWGNDPYFDYFFSDGLKPPTRIDFSMQSMLRYFTREDHPRCGYYQHVFISTLKSWGSDTLPKFNIAPEKLPSR